MRSAGMSLRLFIMAISASARGTVKRRKYAVLGDAVIPVVPVLPEGCGVHEMAYQHKKHPDYDNQHYGSNNVFCMFHF